VIPIRPTTMQPEIGKIIESRGEEMICPPRFSSAALLGIVNAFIEGIVVTSIEAEIH